MKQSIRNPQKTSSIIILLVFLSIFVAVFMLQHAMNLFINAPRVLKALVHPNLFDYPMAIVLSPELITAFVMLFIVIVLIIVLPAFKEENQRSSSEAVVFLSSKLLFSLVFLLTVIAFFLRSYKLSSLPWGFFLDEGFNALDSKNIWDGLYHPVFLTGNGGREALFFYFQALGIGIFGNTIFAVRFMAALFGAMFVPALYFLGRKLFSDKIGLLSAIAATFSAWQLHFSRIGFRYILLPVITAFACTLFINLLERKSKKWAIVGGIVLGIGLYTYVPYRLFPFVLGGYLIHRIIITPSLFKETIKQLLIFSIITIAVISPLLYFFIYKSPWVLERVKQTIALPQAGIFSTGMLIRIGRSFAEFFLWGDPLLRHSIPTFPLFSLIFAVLWIAGLIIALRNIKQPKYLLLLLWHVIMIVPTVISVGIPSSSRSIGVAPAAFILIGIAMHWLWKSISNLVKEKHRYLSSTIMMLIILFAASQELSNYFIFWQKVGNKLPRYQESLYGFCRYETDLVKQLSKMNGSVQVYLSPQLFLHPTIKFIAQDISDIHLLDLSDLNEITSKNKATWVIGEATTRNVWWIRNSSTKNMFFWENQRKGMSDRFLAKIIRMTYGTSNPVMTNDAYLLKQVRNKYPKSYQTQLSGFKCLIIAKSK